MREKDTRYQHRIGQGGRCLSPFTKYLGFKLCEWKKSLLGNPYHL